MTIRALVQMLQLHRSHQPVGRRQPAHMQRMGGSIRKNLAAIAIATALVGSVPTQADAQVIGPVCFVFEEFGDEFLMFFTPSGLNQFAGTGRNRTTGAALSATVFISGSTATLGYSIPLAPTGTGHSVFGSARISLPTGTGTGRCETLNSALGCATGTDTTMSIATCPAIAQDAPLDASPSIAGRSMDGSKQQD